MKSKVYCRIFSIFTVLLMSATVVAQSPQNRGEAVVGRRAQISPEQIARTKTDSLTIELSLTEKQSKEVYKLYLQQATQLFAGLGQFGPGGRPGDGRSMQGPPQGVDRGNMRQGGERPNMQQMEERRQQFGAMMQPAESEKEVSKRDKKMKKILSANQYERWCRLERKTTP